MFKYVDIYIERYLFILLICVESRVESSTHLPFIALCVRKYVFIYENFIFRSLQLLYDLNNFHIDTLMYVARQPDVLELFMAILHKCDYTEFIILSFSILFIWAYYMELLEL